MLIAKEVMEKLKGSEKVDYVISGNHGKILCNKGTNRVQIVSNTRGDYYGVYGDIADEFDHRTRGRIDSESDSDEEIEKVIEYILKYVGDLVEKPEKITDGMLTSSYMSIIYEIVDLKDVATEITPEETKKDDNPMVKFKVLDEEHEMKPEELKLYDFVIRRTVNMRGDVLGETGSVQRKKIDIHKIKEILDDPEISAYSIEQKTGVSRATISKYRKREVAFENLSAGTLMKIAEGLLNDNGQSC